MDGKLYNEGIILTEHKPLYSNGDSVTAYNPDRGFRGSTNIDVYEMSQMNTEKMREHAYNIIKMRMGQFAADPGDTTLVMQNYFYLTGFHDCEITPDGLKAIKIFYTVQLEMGVKGQPRFCYIFEPANGENEDATQEMTLRHIEQISEIMPEIKQCIQAFPICFAGAWGEWHSDYFEHDLTEIAEAVMEKIVVPNGLYALIRLPAYKNLLKNKSYYNRIGIENDSVFGKVPANTPGVSGTGGLDDGSEQWEQLVREAPYTPQEGELYWNNWLINNGVTVDGYKVTLQLSEHRFTTLSIHHSYLDMADRSKSEIGKWKKLSVTAELLDEFGVIYDPNWFKNADGKTVPRNIFEFIRDHLGYRIAAVQTEISGSGVAGTPLKIKLKLKNYGFSAAFNMKSGFALLDGNGNVINEIECGNPEKWYNRDPLNYSNADSPEYTVDGKLMLPKNKTRCSVAFYLRNSAGQCAHLANDFDFINGYNVLYTLN